MRHLGSLFVLISAAASAAACTCAEDTRPWAEVLRDADAVYVGRAVQTRLVAGDPDAEAFELQFDGTEVTVEVERWWKGGRSREARFLTGMGMGDCGVFVQLGAPYVVEAYETEDGRYYTDSCMRTKLAIGPEGAAVPAGLPDGYAPRRVGLLLFAVCAALALAAAVATALFRRREPGAV